MEESPKPKSPERMQKIFDTASDIRKFEIQLFWQRALFFWGFIAAAFVAIATLKNEQPVLSLLVSEFAVVCSLAWTLANRGSKFWQEQWERKIEKVENEITGPLFARGEIPQNKGYWLSGRRYSVSRLAIAVSDSVVLVWCAILGRQVWICIHFGTPGGSATWVVWIIFAPIVPYVIAMLVFAKSREFPNRG